MAKKKVMTQAVSASKEETELRKRYVELSEYIIDLETELVRCRQEFSRVRQAVRAETLASKQDGDET